MESPNANKNPYDIQPPNVQNPYSAHPYGSQTPYTPPNVFGGAVTQDERNMAMLAHLLQIFCGFLGPLIIYLLKKSQSKFVAYHALQALVWQIGYSTVLLGGMAFVFLSVFTGGLHTPGPPMAFIVFWLLAVGGGIVNLILGILFTIKASSGEWASYPIIGNWVRRFI